MSTDLDPLIRDMLAWIGRDPRPYAEVMDAWRTNCPRLTVWEDALERGFVARLPGGLIAVTPSGQSFLAGPATRARRRTGALL